LVTRSICDNGNPNKSQRRIYIETPNNREHPLAQYLRQPVRDPVKIRSDGRVGIPDLPEERHTSCRPLCLALIVHTHCQSKTTSRSLLFSQRFTAHTFTTQNFLHITHLNTSNPLTPHHTRTYLKLLHAILRDWWPHTVDHFTENLIADNQTTRWRRRGEGGWDVQWEDCQSGSNTCSQVDMRPTTHHMRALPAKLHLGERLLANKNLPRECLR
jgi:hypothetical protein